MTAKFRIAKESVPKATSTLADSPRNLHLSLETGLDDMELLTIGKPQQPPQQPQQQQLQQQPPKEQTPSTPETFDRSKNRASERYHVPNKVISFF